MRNVTDEYRGHMREVMLAKWQDPHYRWLVQEGRILAGQEEADGAQPPLPDLLSEPPPYPLPPDAERKLLRFLDAEWELYDGAGARHDAVLTEMDILVSTVVNARLGTADKVRTVWEARRPVEECLARIPASAALEREEVPWAAIEDLIDAACSIRHVQLATATKILHRKRPALIPIYDSVLEEYFRGDRFADYWRSARCGRSSGQRFVARLRPFRHQLRSALPGLRRLCRAAAANGTPISPVRTLEILIWIDNEPRGYYR